MKKLLISLLFATFFVPAFAQKDSGNKVSGLLKKANSLFSKSAGTNLSPNEIADGLKQALSLGAQKSGDQLSAVDGFFKDAAV